MGIKWQCVEYARRWLFIRTGCVFQSIDGAADIWNQVINVQRVVDKKCFPIKTYPNGSPNPPKNESLIIYSRATPDMPDGHVAVIVDIVPGFLHVAEENLNFYYWSSTYARQIPLVVKNGSYYIEDVYRIDGWMSVEDNNQLKPLDQSTINTIIKQNQSFPDFICSKSTIHHCSSLYYYLFLCFTLLCLAFH
jgi:glutathionylspermidine amidase/synthetase